MGELSARDELYGRLRSGLVSRARVPWPDLLHVQSDPSVTVASLLARKAKAGAVLEHGLLRQAFDLRLPVPADARLPEQWSRGDDGLLVFSLEAWLTVTVRDAHARGERLDAAMAERASDHDA